MAWPLRHRPFFDDRRCGHGPGNPAYRYTEIQDIGGLPGVVGL